MKCKFIACTRFTHSGEDFCPDCVIRISNTPVALVEAPEPSMAERYPQYYKRVEGPMDVDVYSIHQLFEIQDPSGAIQHASKKLLLSGVRTGGKSQYKDVREARDTLTRWLEINHASSLN
jgi:hypothetical protein